MQTHFGLLIDNQWVESASGGRFDSRNPATGAVHASVAEAGADDVDRAVRSARRAFVEGPWPAAGGYDRGRLLRRVAEAIRARADDLAAAETADNGKAIRETRAQVAASADYFDYYAGWADKLEGQVVPVRGAFHTYVVREPVGVVAGIIPWNSPLPQASQKIAPALAAGCTIVLKPAEQTPVTAMLLGAILVECGVPPGVVNIVNGPGATTGAALVRHPGVAKVAFTGSVATGQRIAQDCVPRLARVSLELGGKAPNIVFDDADLERAVRGTLFGIFAGAGQYCDAGPRLLVQRAIRARFVESLLAMTARIRVGDPTDPKTHVGSLSSPEHRAKVEGYIEIGQREGARLLAGGGRPQNPALAAGCFVVPTVFDRVDPGMRIAREEIFGPVLSIIDFDDEAEAIRIANDVDFGLVAGVWTSDMRRAHRCARALEAGTVWINTFRQTQISAPFGGYKMSGIGREKGRSGLEEFSEEKTVWIDLGGGPIGYFDDEG